MANFILWCFIVTIVASLAKFIYDVQQNKKREKEADELCAIEAEFELKEMVEPVPIVKPTKKAKPKTKATKKIKTNE